MTTKQVIARARIVRELAARKLIEARDAALVAQGKAAKIRQRKRAVKAALRKIGKAVVMAGAAAATVAAAKAARRALRRRPTRTA